MTLTSEKIPVEGRHSVPIGVTPKGEIGMGPPPAPIVDDGKCFRCGGPLDDEAVVVEAPGVGRLGRACPGCYAEVRIG